MRGLMWACTLLAFASAPAGAQELENIGRERSEYLEWLETADNSPLNAVAQQPIGTGLRLGPPDADLPLEGIGEHRLTAAAGSIVLEGPEGHRQVRRSGPVALGPYTVVVEGPSTQPVVTVFRKRRTDNGQHEIAYFPLTHAFSFTGHLIPPAHPSVTRILGVDGIEVEAAEAGSVIVPLGDHDVRLRVRRVPTGGEESELEIFFRDATNSADTYPAGRFVPLIPMPRGRYRLDFNRARNPFCAYSSAYPCPAPWAGNTIPLPVRAGEKYEKARP